MLKKIATFALLVFLLKSNLICANLCNNRDFSMSLTPSVNALEIFEQISLECGFGLVVDEMAAAKLRSPLFSMRINNVKLDEILEIFAKQNDLLSNLAKNLLKSARKRRKLSNSTTSTRSARA